MVVVIVAYEYGIERWEMPGLAGVKRLGPIEMY
jgi:hypothetical protein